MLKKILTIGSFAAIAAAFGFNNTDSANEEVSVSDLISANTEALAYCPNGCVEGGSSCFCNGYEYPLRNTVDGNIYIDVRLCQNSNLA